MKSNFERFVEKYLNAVSIKFSHKETTEMGYRADFEILLKEIFESIKVNRIDHDAKAEDGNKPDFVIIKNVPILYIETKDIGVSLDRVEKSEQMARYYGYTNLVLTDYLEYRFYRNGLSYGNSISIGSYDKIARTITTNPSRYEYLVRTLLEFANSHKEPIKSGSHLAKIMGGKALRIRDNVRFLMGGSDNKDQSLTKLYDAIKEMLVKDLTPHSFADMYAQTLVYGLFVARYNDKTPENFSRSEARDLISNSNKFLQRFFDHIVGVEFKSSLKYIVDELCEVFSHADVTKLTEDYYNKSKEDVKYYDPVIHFYEDFLKEYDPVLKKQMGAYYTPQPVVDFIVKSVDHLLKKEFNLTGGIGDTTKLPNGLHKVQILDPATGTGTFISTVIREIYKPFKQNKQEGRWPAYVHNDLLPRIHAFELMIAPYTIAHLRLGIAFRKTGFWNFHRRLGIYLTNALENDQKLQLTMSFGLAESIAEESKEASIIKNQTPIMIIIGNPPYSGISSNETTYANSLVERYKVEPGGKLKLKERKHWLNDDYVKFIGLAESMIEKNGSGIVAMITNNGYLDNPTFRGMRWRLTKTFDKIYLLDLHGNSKKKEKALDGGKDENVFDIMQGVGIMLAIKNGKKQLEEISDVYHAELFGTRKYKFEKLTQPPIWQKIQIDYRKFNFTPWDSNGSEVYEKGFSLKQLFIKHSTGILTARDSVVLDFDKTKLKSRMAKFSDTTLSDDVVREWLFPDKSPGKYKAGDSRGWKMSEARKVVARQNIAANIVLIKYRPFDERYIYYIPEMVDWGRFDLMKNYKKDNIGLLFSRMTKGKDYAHIHVTDKISEVIYLSPITGTNAFNAPLYLYSENGSKIPNLENDIVRDIEKIVGKITPENVFDYVYAMLHSPTYRKKYQEFLKNDFPRIPYPTDIQSFNKLVELGEELRQLHLLKSPNVKKFTTTYSMAGTDLVEKPSYVDGKVYINNTQYYGNVPEIAWNFWVGGYQPAQKWLKDRKGRTLSNEDIEHYQQIISSLTETNRVMHEIDKVLV